MMWFKEEHFKGIQSKQRFMEVLIECLIDDTHESCPTSNGMDLWLSGMGVCPNRSP